MRVGTSASALWLALLALPSTAYAQAVDDDYCDTLDLADLNAECVDASVDADLLVDLPGFPAAGKDALVFDANNRGNIGLQGDTDFRIEVFRPWRSVYIGSTGAAQASFDIVAKPGNVSSMPNSIRFAVQNLTLDNVVLRTPFFTSGGITTSDQVTEFQIGDGLNAGTLNLSNASFLPDTNTRVSFSGDGNSPARINALSGDNFITIRNQELISNGLRIDIASGANLTVGASLISNENSSLTMASGSKLTVRGGTLQLNDSVFDANPASSMVDNAQITVSRQLGGAALIIGNTTFNDATLEIADTLQIANFDPSQKGSGTATFTGDNIVNLSDNDSLFSTSQDPFALSGGTILVQSIGTTQFTGAGQINSQRFVIDTGILDVSGVDFGAFFREEGLRSIDIRNDGVFIDGAASIYSALLSLNINGGTLRYAGELGSYAGSAGGARYTFNDAVLNPNFDGDPTQVGRSLVLRASDIRFTGSNVVFLAFDPNGQCISDGTGGCIGSVRFYNDSLNLDVGNNPTASLTGFSTITFLPIANGAYAPSAFINGGNNGIYTISQVNTDPRLEDITLPDGTQITPQGYDALPHIPTLGDLSASGSNLPANLSYVIINDPLQDDRIDIAFVERNLGNHPDLAAAYTAGETIRTVTEPETGNVSTITVTITPDTDGTAMETTNVVVTEPDGEVVSTSSVTVELDKPTGTENTQAAGQLLSNSAKNGSSLPFIPHQNLAQQITSFHPEPYSSFLTVGLEQLDLFRNMALDRAGSGGLSVNARESETQTRKRVWLDTSLVDGNVDGSGNLGNFDYELISFAIGIDLMSRQDARLGVFVGYGHQKMDEHDIAEQDFSADTYHVGAYGQYLSGQWDVRATLAYARGTNESERLTSLGSITSTNRANFNSDGIYAGLKVQYDGLIDTEALSISPEVGLGYSYLRQEALVETGATQTALALESATAESIVTSAGLNFGLLPSAKIHPVGFVRFERDWYANNNRAHEIRARLATTPGQPAEVFIGQNRGPDALIAGIGLASSPSSGVQLGGGIVYANTTNGEELGGGFSLQVSF